MSKLEKAKEIVRQGGRCIGVACDYWCENQCPLHRRCYTDSGLEFAKQYIAEHEFKRGVPVPTVRKMTVSEVCKELGYDIEIVKG